MGLLNVCIFAALRMAVCERYALENAHYYNQTRHKFPFHELHPFLSRQMSMSALRTNQSQIFHGNIHGARNVPDRHCSPEWLGILERNLV